jgi:hypothetical protein
VETGRIFLDFGGIYDAISTATLTIDAAGDGSTCANTLLTFDFVIYKLTFITLYYPSMEYTA